MKFGYLKNVPTGCWTCLRIPFRRTNWSYFVRSTYGRCLVMQNADCTTVGPNFINTNVSCCFSFTIKACLPNLPQHAVSNCDDFVPASQTHDYNVLNLSKKVGTRAKKVAANVGGLLLGWYLKVVPPGYWTCLSIESVRPDWSKFCNVRPAAAAD